ncbi:MAG: GNAT family N-acetyltransferase [Alcanivorax sp.]|nr:GNAT family N-acetyltransferase [Alcanivorax sp.]
MRFPFLTDAFLGALEDTGAATPERGWAPCHLRNGPIKDSHPQEDDAFLPLYVRDGSRGEYVFDFAWADAYQRHGLPYYPKLVSAIPFTPVVGPRWRGDWPADELWRQVRERVREQGASGWHLLFPDRAAREALAALPLIERQACHFRWFNRDYADFEAFLATFNSRKRKSVRRERRRVAEQGLTVERLTGADIGPESWRFFYHCYANTYLVRGQLPYLSEAFFLRLAERLGDQLLLVLARHGDEPVAAGLYLFDDRALYGRYWGSVREYDALHFEVCYYQGIEFAIERGLAEFDPGVQGEHKILRGFEPVLTYSLHWLAEPAFHEAVADFCQREARQVLAYRDEARTLLPYRADQAGTVTGAGSVDGASPR